MNWAKLSAIKVSFNMKKKVEYYFNDRQILNCQLKKKKKSMEKKMILILYYY